MAVLDRAYQAQVSVIGSMLIDERCIPLVLSKLTPDDFTDGTCKETFRAVRKLAMAGKSADPVTVVDAMQGGDRYIAWCREAMEITPTAANVEAYIPMVRRAAVRRRVLELSEKLAEADDDAEDGGGAVCRGSDAPDDSGGTGGRLSPPDDQQGKAEISALGHSNRRQMRVCRIRRYDFVGRLCIIG